MHTVDAAGLAIGDDHPPRIMGVLNVSVESPYSPSVFDDPAKAASYVEDDLIAEIEEIASVVQPDRSLLVLDAAIGQGAKEQARQFEESVSIDGVVITKLDGTAAGGVVFAIAESLALPIRFIGVGEATEDLDVFDAERFVDALFSDRARN